jgi:hypothetical protein
MLPSEYLQRGWTQWSLARGKSGRAVEPTGRAAISWCMTGAIWAYGGESRLTKAIRNIVGAATAIGWNDEVCQSQAQAVAVMRAAEKAVGLR